VPCRTHCSCLCLWLFVRDQDAGCTQATFIHKNSTIKRYSRAMQTCVEHHRRTQTTVTATHHTHTRTHLAPSRRVGFDLRRPTRRACVWHPSLPSLPLTPLASHTRHNAFHTPEIGWPWLLGVSVLAHQGEFACKVGGSCVVSLCKFSKITSRKSLFLHFFTHKRRFFGNPPTNQHRDTLGQTQLGGGVARSVFLSVGQVR